MRKPPTDNLCAAQAARRKARRVRSCQSWQRMLQSRVLSFFLTIAPLFSAGLANASEDEDVPLVFLGDKDYPPAAYLEEGDAEGNGR
jgi:hypothetical protein